MAKLSVTVAFTFTLLLFFLTLSQARIPSNLPENEAIGRELPHSRPDSDVSSVLRLPSNGFNDESHSIDPAGVIPETESISVRSIPLRLVRFRPMNRHFPIRSSFPFRNCRQHRHHHRDHPFFKPIRQQEQEHQPKQRVEIPYGNDMILSTGENSEFDPLMFHQGRLRRIPAKWVKFHHHHHDDDHEEEDDGFSKSVLKHSHRFGKEKFKKHLHNHHKDHDHDEEEEEEENQVEKNRESKREKEGSFVNRIRKFLDHF